MLYRTLALALAGALVVAGVGYADDKDKKDAPKDTHSGTVVSVDADKMMLVMKDASGKDEHKHKVAKDADISCDGKKCKLEDLKAGTKITVTCKDDADKTVTKIVATTKDTKKDS